MDNNNNGLVCPRCNLRYQYLVNFCSSCGWFMREPFSNAPKIEYDFEKGVYPAGQYIAGRDLMPGGYIITPLSLEQAYLTIYKNYKDFINENDEITYTAIRDVYHFIVEDNKNLISIENAYIKKIS